MQFFMSAVVVIAGMAFSLAVALLVEEIIFGQVFRLIGNKQISAQQILPAESVVKR